MPASLLHHIENAVDEILRNILVEQERLELSFYTTLKLVDEKDRYVKANDRV